MFDFDVSFVAGKAFDYIRVLLHKIADMAQHLCSVGHTASFTVEIGFSGWLGDTIGRTSDLRFTGCAFESWPGTTAYK